MSFTNENFIGAEGDGSISVCAELQTSFPPTESVAQVDVQAMELTGTCKYYYSYKLSCKGPQ